jgi:drug/metabolite transporter (DMT)-like permease
VPKVSANYLGSMYMTVGSIGYVVNDAFVRRITEDGPSVYQVLCLRSVGLAALLAIIARMRGELTTRVHLTRPLLLRVSAETIATVLFFAAIVHLEFANAQAILQVVPFAVMLTAALVLRERVRLRQYAAILLGFAGVLIVVRPATDGFSAWSLAILASAAFLVIREFATRDVEANIPAFSVALMTAVGVAILTGALSVFDDWRALDPQGWFFLAIAIGALAIGYVFAIKTVRIGDLSVTAPFRYTVLVGAVIIGYFLFDEVPDRFTVIGCLVIVATGVYSVRLERLSPA